VLENVTGSDAANKIEIDTKAPTLSIDGLGGDDTIVMKNSMSNTREVVIHGGAGNDTINNTNTSYYGVAGTTKVSVYGDAGDDVITGSVQNEFIDGGPGKDTITAGPGNDTIMAADGEADTIGCGSGADTATVDQFDTVAQDSDNLCETISKQGVAPPTPPTPPGPPPCSRQAARCGGGVVPKAWVSKWPAKSGRARVGRTVRVGGPVFSAKGKGQGLKVAYRWYLSGKPIKGANKASLRIKPSYRGKKLAVRVTISRAGYRPLARVIRFGKVR
jgi:hypothetical protein